MTVDACPVVITDLTVHALEDMVAPGAHDGAFNHRWLKPDPTCRVPRHDAKIVAA
jgi:hypothetical protein